MTDRLSSLTSRERIVFQLISCGFNNKDISSNLHISQNTINNHKKNIFNKLGLKSTAQLIFELGYIHKYSIMTAIRQQPQEMLLSGRQREIVDLILSGFTSKEIARKLSISDLTVRKHRENIYRKLHVTSARELALVWSEWVKLYATQAIAKQ